MTPDNSELPSAARLDRDAGLVNSIRSGDRTALNEIAEEYFRPLFDFVAAITRDSAASKDIVQDLFLTVWMNRSDFEPATSIKAYLFRAARNRALNFAQRRRPLVEPSLELASDDDPSSGIQYEALLADYHAAIAQLPERRRTVFTLVRLYGLSYHEVASVLGVSTNTVRTQMSDALRAVRTALGKYL